MHDYAFFQELAAEQKEYCEEKRNLEAEKLQLKNEVEEISQQLQELQNILSETQEGRDVIQQVCLHCETLFSFIMCNIIIDVFSYRKSKGMQK